VTLKLEQKQAIVAEVNETAGKALSAVLADYRGLTVGQMTQMRSKARASGVYLKVVRNTLARRGVEGTEYACLQEALTGPTVLAFSLDDPGAAARLMKGFAKDFEKLEIKAVSIGGALLPAVEIDRVATLPTRNEALATLMSVMLAPIGKLARTLNEVPGKLVRTVAAIGEKKQAEAGSA
jgi:large subunit ribosomal protein L10